MRSKKIISLIIILAFAFTAGAIVVHYLFFTTEGAEGVVKSVLADYLETESVTFEKIEGILAQALLVEGVKIEKSKSLPPESIFQIQRLEAAFSPFRPGELAVKIDNGRLGLPDSDPIYFFGGTKDGGLEFKVYAREVDAREILGLFIKAERIKEISGVISELDVLVNGSFSEPELKGKFRITTLSRSGFSLVNCPGRFSFRLRDIKNNLKLAGTVELESGTVVAREVKVELLPSKILISDNLEKPSLYFKGKSTVEGVEITILLKGTIAEPELKLTSEPPLAETRIMFMLATGRSWQRTEDAVVQGRIMSRELVSDFLDYLIFSGPGGTLATHFGLTDLSVRLNDQSQGVGLTKKVSRRTEIKYDIEQSREKTEGGGITQKLGGIYRITERISVEGERELKQEQAIPADEEEAKVEKIIIKYKRKF